MGKFIRLHDGSLERRSDGKGPNTAPGEPPKGYLNLLGGLGPEELSVGDGNREREPVNYRRFGFTFHGRHHVMSGVLGHRARSAKRIVHDPGGVTGGGRG